MAFAESSTQASGRLTSISSENAFRFSNNSSSSSAASSSFAGGNGSSVFLGLEGGLHHHQVGGGSSGPAGHSSSSSSPSAGGGAAASVFHREVPVLLDDDREAHLNVHIRVQEGRLFELDVTDEADPLFLCGVRLTDADFHALKREQGLRVDFTAFPGVVVELLEGCIETAAGGEAAGTHHHSPQQQHHLNQQQQPQHAEDHSSDLSAVAHAEGPHATSGAFSGASGPASPNSTHLHHHNGSVDLSTGSASSCGSSSSSPTPLQNLQCHLRSAATAALDGTGIGGVGAAAGTGGNASVAGSAAGSAGSLASAAGNSLVLSIVEPKRLRLLSHLRLVLRPATDQALQRHLASRLTAFRGACERLSAQLATSESSRSRTEALLREAEQTGERAASSLKDEHIAALKRSEELHVEQLSAAQALHQEHMDKERSDRLAEVAALRAELQAAQRDAADQRASNVELEGEVRTLSARVQQGEVALETAKMAAEQGTAGFEARLEDKEALVAKMAALLEAANRSRAELAEQLAEIKLQRGGDSEQVEFHKAEVAKGNEIIGRLQARIKTLADQARVASALAEKSQATEELRTTELREERERIELLKHESGELSRQLAERIASEEGCREELALLRQEHDKAENVITFLNKELSEARTGVLAPASSSAYGHGAAASYATNNTHSAARAPPRYSSFTSGLRASLAPAAAVAPSAGIHTTSSATPADSGAAAENGGSSGGLAAVSAYRRRAPFREQRPRPTALSTRLGEEVPTVGQEARIAPVSAHPEDAQDFGSAGQENRSETNTTANNSTLLNTSASSAKSNTSSTRSPAGPPQLRTQARAQAREERGRR